MVKASNSMSSSSSKISINGSLNDCVVMKRSKESNNEGNNNKFASIANNNVTETNKPRATVPPNSDAINIAKPKNRTIEV